MTSLLPDLPHNITPDLLEKLKTLEKRKEKQLNKKFMWGFLMVMSGPFVAITLALLNLYDDAYIIFIILTVLTLLVLFLKNIAQQQKIKNEFKTEVIKKIVTYLLPQIDYAPSTGFSDSEIEKTGIFNINKPISKSEDAFSGKRGNTSFKFSEIDTKYKTENYYKKRIQKRIPTYLPYFSGILIQCKKKFPITHSARINPTNLWTKIVHDGMVNYSFEDKAIDEKYVFHGYPNKNYSAVLNPNFTQLIKTIYDLYKEGIYVSIFPKSISIAIESKINHFEPKMNKKIDLEQVNRIYQEIVNCLYIIDLIDTFGKVPETKRISTQKK